MKKYIIIAVAVMVVMMAAFLKFWPHQPVATVKPPKPVIIVNPTKQQEKPKAGQSINNIQIQHHITVPANTKPGTSTTVPDVITGGEGAVTNDGKATVTTNTDGSETITIPEKIQTTITTPVFYRFKAVVTSDPNIMLGFTYKEYDYKIVKEDFDLMVGTSTVGVGTALKESRYSIGIGAIYDWKTFDKKAIIYGGYSF